MRLVAAALAVATLAAPPAAAQRPGVDMASLLNMQFHPPSGQFNPRDVLLLFGSPDAEVGLEVTDASGRVLHRTPFTARESRDFSVVWLLSAQGPEEIELGRPGTYTTSVVVDGEVVGAYTFTLSAVESGDPFAPGTTWSAEGPWRTRAHLGQRVGAPGESLRFEYWISTRETGGEQASISLSLRRDGEEVARSRSDFVVSSPAWQFFSNHQLVKPGNLHPFTAADLAAHDGRYSLVVLAGGAPVKSYDVTVENGQIRPHPRSALDAEPRAGFLAPRVFPSNRGSLYALDAWWVEASE